MAKVPRKAPIVGLNWCAGKTNHMKPMTTRTQITALTMPSRWIVYSRASSRSVALGVGSCSLIATLLPHPLKVYHHVRACRRASACATTEPVRRALGGAGQVAGAADGRVARGGPPDTMGGRTARRRLAPGLRHAARRAGAASRPRRPRGARAGCADGSRRPERYDAEPHAPALRLHHDLRHAGAVVGGLRERLLPRA